MIEMHLSNFNVNEEAFDVTLNFNRSGSLVIKTGSGMLYKIEEMARDNIP